MSNKPRKQKRKPQVKFKGDKTYSLVRSLGSGVALWRCKQTGEYVQKNIADRVWVPRLGRKTEYLQSVFSYLFYWRGSTALFVK